MARIIDRGKQPITSFHIARTKRKRLLLAGHFRNAVKQRGFLLAIERLIVINLTGQCDIIRIRSMAEVENLSDISTESRFVRGLLRARSTVIRDLLLGLHLVKTLQGY